MKKVFNYIFIINSYSLFTVDTTSDILNIKNKINIIDTENKKIMNDIQSLTSLVDENKNLVTKIENYDFRVTISNIIIPIIVALLTGVLSYLGYLHIYKLDSKARKEDTKKNNDSSIIKQYIVCLSHFSNSINNIMSLIHSIQQCFLDLFSKLDENNPNVVPDFKKDTLSIVKDKVTRIENIINKYLKASTYTTPIEKATGLSQENVVYNFDIIIALIKRIKNPWVISEIIQQLRQQIIEVIEFIPKDLKRIYYDFDEEVFVALGEKDTNLNLFNVRVRIEEMIGIAKKKIE